jgi:hypothetical protein
MIIYPEKKTHKFLLLLNILNDYFKSDFCCSAPIEGAVGGCLRMNINTITKAIAVAKKIPAYK